MNIHLESKKKPLSVLMSLWVVLKRQCDHEKVCELVDTHTLNQLKDTFQSYSMGLYMHFKLKNLLNNVYMYSGNKNINTFLIKQYFATYVAFSSSIKTEIFDKVT